MSSDWMSQIQENYIPRPGRVAKWREVLDIVEFGAHLKANRVAASYAGVICCRVYAAYATIGSINELVDCDVDEMIDRKFPEKGRRGRSEIRTAVVRFQKFKNEGVSLTFNEILAEYREYLTDQGHYSESAKVHIARLERVCLGCEGLDQMLATPFHKISLVGVGESMRPKYAASVWGFKCWFTHIRPPGREA